MSYADKTVGASDMGKVPGGVARSDPNMPYMQPITRTPPVTNEPEGGSALAAGIFQLAGLTAIGFGAAFLTVPETMHDLAFGKKLVTDIEVALMRMYGGTLFAQAAVKYVLKESSDEMTLTSFNNQWLMIGVMLQAVQYLGAYMAAPKVLRTPIFSASFPAISVISLAVTGLIYLKSNNGDFKLPILRPLTFTNPTSSVYSVMMISYVGCAAAVYIPDLLFPDMLDSSSMFFKHSIGGAFVLAGVMSGVLSHEADKGRMGSTTAKTLNLGLGLMESVMAGVLYKVTTAGQVSSPTTGWFCAGLAAAKAAFPLYQYFFKTTTKKYVE
jgi:hypothetical protein